MTSTDSFGYWLRRRRKALDMTQRALAQQIPCSLAMIKKIEADTRRPSPQLAARLAECLGLAPHEQTLILAVAQGKRPINVLELADTPLRQVAPMDVLPVAPTPFIGRRAEVNAALALLDSADVRLVTVVGPGGMGKTRLAVAVAQALQQRKPRPFPDGIVFVDLTAVADAAAIVPAIADRLGLDLAERRNDSRSPREKLRAFLAPRRMLLILDNFEHLLTGVVSNAAVDLLPDVLAAAPDLKLLVTSRLRLHLREEHLYSLPGMLQPAVTESADVAGLLDHDAPQLFLGTARRVRPDFTLAPADTPVLMDICAALGGMPLALELAAAWVDTLSPAGIARELAQGLDLLNSELHDLPARHRNMRRTLDATWRMLTSDERAAFIRLSVFRGGFDQAAAADVAQAWLGTLSKLIGKSLVEFLPQAERYHIHEVLRQYGAEKLVEDGTQAATRQRHFDHYLALVTDAHDHFFGAAQIDWLERLEADQDNLRACLSWGLDHPERHDDTAALVTMLSWFWRIRSHVLEARDWLERMLAQPDLAEVHRAGLLYHAGHFAWMQDDFQGARRYQEESLALWRALGESGLRGAAYATATYGMTLYGSELHAPDDLMPALAAFEEARNMARAVDDPWGEAFALQWLAFTQTARGQFDAAMDCAQQSVALYTRLGESWGRGMVTGALANLSLQAGNLAQARRYAGEALAMRVRVGHRHSVGVGYELLATIARREGDLPDAAQSYRHGIAIFDSLGNRPYADKLRERLAALLMEG